MVSLVRRAEGDAECAVSTFAASPATPPCPTTRASAVTGVIDGMRGMGGIERGRGGRFGAAYAIRRPSRHAASAKPAIAAIGARLTLATAPRIRGDGGHGSMKTCIECGKPINTGGYANSHNLRCRICITARALRLPTPRRRARRVPEFVQEKGTGVRGRVLRRVWLVDQKTDAPAKIAYVVQFDDGREKRVLKSEVEILK